MIEMMLDWWFGTQLEGEHFEVAEDQQQEDQQYPQDNFEEGKCTKGPLYLWTITIHIHACV